MTDQEAKRGFLKRYDDLFRKRPLRRAFRDPDPYLIGNARRTCKEKRIDQPGPRAEFPTAQNGDKNSKAYEDNDRASATRIGTKFRFGARKFVSTCTGLQIC